MKDIVILGGPNGAGKTTAAMVLMPGLLRSRVFVNADEIARKIAPANAEAAALAAGRQMIERMRELVCEGRSFVLETTCSGRSNIPMLKACKVEGWRIYLYYFWLNSPELSIARVAKRVSEGGHHIPEDVIVRRFTPGLSNMLNLYLPLADEAKIYDNSDRRRILVAEKRLDSAIVIHDLERWSRMEDLTQ